MKLTFSACDVMSPLTSGMRASARTGMIIIAPVT